MVILIYVHDIIITWSHKEGITLTKALLKSFFDIKDLGELTYFLGIGIYWSKEELFLSQRKYTFDLLSDAYDLGGSPTKNPLEDGYKVLRKGKFEDKTYGDVKQYRKMVWKLIYLTITRSDVCFAVSTCKLERYTTAIWWKISWNIWDKHHIKEYVWVATRVKILWDIDLWRSLLVNLYGSRDWWGTWAYRQPLLLLCIATTRQQFT